MILWFYFYGFNKLKIFGTSILYDHHFRREGKGGHWKEQEDKECRKNRKRKANSGSEKTYSCNKEIERQEYKPDSWER
jgi:hypothetical protein